MEFNVSELLKAHTGATRDYDIDDELSVDGEQHGVRGHMRMDRTPNGILVRARLSGEMSGQCSRCLKSISYPVQVVMEEEYIPTVDVYTGAHVEPPEGLEDAYRINERHILDLGEPAAQYWT